MKNNPKFIRTTLSGIAIWLLILLGAAVWHINSNDKKTARLLSEANKASQKELLVQGVKLARNTEMEAIEAFENIILTDKDIVPVIETIESTGSALGLETKISSVDKLAGEGEPAQTIRLAIEAGGLWGGLYSFVRALESLPYKVEFRELNLSKSEAGWLANIVISLYSFD